jgi:hypothetical protein
LRAKRSNPEGLTRPKNWIASSQGLLAMTGADVPADVFSPKPRFRPCFLHIASQLM